MTLKHSVSFIIPALIIVHGEVVHMVLGGVEISAGTFRGWWSRYSRRYARFRLQWHSDVRRHTARTTVSVLIVLSSAAYAWSRRGSTCRFRARWIRLRELLRAQADALRTLPLVRRTQQTVCAWIRYVHLMLYAYLPARIPLRAQHDPITVEACIHHVEELRIQLELAVARGAKHRHGKQPLRRALRTLVFQIDADLQRGRTLATAGLFQVRWSLNLLADAVVRKGADPRPLLDLWLQGAYQTLGKHVKVSVGPTNRAFLRLMRVSQAA